MIWFFDRAGEKLRYEISHDRTAGRYRVVITHPDGTESVEEVDEPTELAQFLCAASIDTPAARRPEPPDEGTT